MKKKEVYEKVDTKYQKKLKTEQMEVKNRHQD